MKKYLVGTFLASMLVVVPFVSSALSPVINAPQVVKDKAVVAQVYESGIQKLKTTYQLRITNPHSNSLYITQSYSPFYLSFVNETRPNVYGDVRSCRVVSYTTSAGVPLARDDKGTAYLVLEPGKTIKYTVVKTCNTNELLSGTYKSRLNTIQYANTLSPVSFMGVDLSHISSDNSVYVVGEKSPWLEKVVLKDGTDEGWVDLYGERLSSAYVNKIYLGDKFVDVTSNSSSTKISFNYKSLNPNLFGLNLVYVSGPYGESNRLSLYPGGVMINEPIFSDDRFEISKVTLDGVSYLKTFYHIDVSAQGSNIYMPKLLPFGVYIYEERTGKITQNCTFSNVAETGTPVETDRMGEKFYFIRDGDTKWIDSTTLCPSRDLPGGVYYGVIEGVRYKNSLDQPIVIVPFGGTTDNREIIYGGEDAFIDFSASTLRTYPGGWLKFRGKNLTTNVVGFKYPVIGAKLSDGNKRLDFKVDPRQIPGPRVSWVIGDNGKESNQVQVEIFSKPTTTSATQFGQIANILSALWSVLEQLKTQ